jgi:thiol-disulfide isomerase/thioredoxin
MTKMVSSRRKLLISVNGRIKSWRLIVGWTGVAATVGVAMLLLHRSYGSHELEAFSPFPLTVFQGKDLDGNLIDLSSFNGTITLANFWATWCGPCRAEMPDLVTLQRRYAGKLRVIGIAVDERNEEGVRRFVKNLGVTYPVVLGGTQPVGGLVSSDYLPLSYLVAPDRKVTHRFVGRIHLPSVSRTIDEMLQQRPDVPAKR